MQRRPVLGCSRPPLFRNPAHMQPAPLLPPHSAPSLTRAYRHCAPAEPSCALAIHLVQLSAHLPPLRTTCPCGGPPSCATHKNNCHNYCFYSLTRAYRHCAPAGPSCALAIHLVQLRVHLRHLHGRASFLLKPAQRQVGNRSSVFLLRVAFQHVCTEVQRCSSNLHSSRWAAVSSMLHLRVAVQHVCAEGQYFL